MRQACSKLTTLCGLLDSIHSYSRYLSLLIFIVREEKGGYFSVHIFRECEKDKPVLQELLGAKRKRTKIGGARHGCLVFAFSFVVLLMHDTSLRSSISNLLFVLQERMSVFQCSEQCFVQQTNPSSDS